MAADSPDLAADLVGSASPPRDNGEIVFETPWERRVFGLAVVACQSDRCDWAAFRERLIGRIADDETQPYWQSWAAALEDVLEANAVLTRRELNERQREMVSYATASDHHERLGTTRR